MNIVLIVVLIVMICTAINGYKKGMIDELFAFIALIAGVALLAIVASVIGNYITKDTKNVIIGVILFVIIVILMQVIQVVSKGLRLIFNLPLINILNKLAGLALGAIEGIIILWILFVVLQFFTFGDVGVRIMQDVRQNMFLSYLYQNNYVRNIFNPVYELWMNISQTV